MIICGQCFEWAYEALPKRGAFLVHGVVHHPWDGRPFEHAWIERNGRVFDWQSVVQGLGPGPRGWPRAKFYEVYKPVDVVKYDYADARLEALRSGHSGPWKEAP